MRNLPPILHLLGMLLLVLSGAMLIPSLVDFCDGDQNWQAFLNSALITSFCGAVTTLAYQPHGTLTLNTRQAFLLTTSAWLVVCLFGSLPFLFAKPNMSLTDSYFETMSGLTTAGSTVIVNLDCAPLGILLWRSLLQFLGGAGIIVMAVALLPMLRIGGMQLFRMDSLDLFRMESSDKADKSKPRLSQVAGNIITVYMIFCILCMICLWLAGMEWFDAVTHAMATMSTGGFSTHDMSIGYFRNSGIEWVTISFMMIGATTLALFVTPWRHSRWKIFRDSQVRWFYGSTAGIILILATWLWVHHETTVAYIEVFRLSAFNVVSIITTTGFSSEDYTKWGKFPEMTFFWITLIGGCTGSSSGAIKIFRFQVLFSLAVVQFKKLLHPAGVFPISFEKEQISEDIVRSVQGFFILYTICFAVVAGSLMAVGTDPMTALSGSATTLSNVGPGLGPVIGPTGTFSLLPDIAKWILAFTMLLGRLELLTVLVLLKRDFWSYY